ncbi:MAG: hypothetical protein KIT79_15355 [Deltaproteobacteria bacterium]|nr:hypothetical protein [Deltaproteobacteria bacterium]
MPSKKSRKNPAPLVGSVIANPALYTKRLKGGEKVYFNVGQNAKVERSQTRPQYIIVTAPQDAPGRPKMARRRPPAPPPPAPVQPAPVTPRPAQPRPMAPRPAPGARPRAKQSKSHKKHRRPKPPSPATSYRPPFPPFTRPSEQTRQNPLFGGGDSGAGEMAKTAGEALMVFVALGLGIPLVKRVLLNVLRKPEAGPDGKPTVVSHAIQAGLAAIAFGAAGKAIKDSTLKTLVQGAAVATAVAPAVNQLIEKIKPGAGLRLLGDPADSAPISLNFNVDPLPLTEGLSADLQDLDTNPAIDRMLTEKAADLGAPQVAPAGEPLFRGLGSPQVAPASEPLFRGLGEAEERLLDPADTDPAGPTSIAASEPLHLGALYIN